MKYFDTILDTIGNTPMVKINVLTKELEALVLAKIESTNPGNSVKDRISLKMIEQAEAEGKLKPGSTIIEGTSGNTGMGLALAAIIKGYKLICVSNDKQSKEKFDVLRAVGAEVVVCPTSVEPDDPRSYYSVSKKLAEETPNSWYVDQYYNLFNKRAHYESTAPEIWEQTGGKITHFVVGVGTGGTISGVAKYLKEKNPKIKIWGIDTYGSVLKKYFETGIFDKNEIYSYITEGIGEDILPANLDFSLIDGFEKVTDKDAAIYTRKLAREEGIFVGNSAGAAIKGVLQLKHNFKKDDVVVVLFHDHGSRYVNKIFNDDWMRERGFIVDEKKLAKDILSSKSSELVYVRAEELVFHAIEKMRKNNISQMPVERDGGFVGSLDDSHILSLFFENNNVMDLPVGEIMQDAFPILPKESSIKEISKHINKENPAVLIKTSDNSYQIIARHDLVVAMQ